MSGNPTQAFQIRRNGSSSRVSLATDGSPGLSFRNRSRPQATSDRWRTETILFLREENEIKVPSPRYNRNGTFTYATTATTATTVTTSFLFCHLVRLPSFLLLVDKIHVSTVFPKGSERRTIGWFPHTISFFRRSCRGLGSVQVVTTDESLDAFKKKQQRVYGFKNPTKIAK